MESPQHWLSCEAYREFRDGIDPELVKRDGVHYLRKVIKKRKVLVKQLKCLEEDNIEEDEMEETDMQ